MTNELHWEWRGFGGVSGRFIKQYCELPLIIDSEIIKDLYLVIPDLYVNTKFRTGAEGGLKFKRLRKREGDFEKWLEDTEELYDFPLDNTAWKNLSNTLQQVGRDLPEYPQERPDRETTLEYLMNAGCKPLEVEKNRESRLLKVSDGQVKVEWACLSKPQSMISIGIENWSDSEPNRKNDTAKKNELSEAIKILNLDHEPLKTMNYLDAVKIWAEGNKI